MSNDVASGASGRTDSGHAPGSSPPQIDKIIATGSSVADASPPECVAQERDTRLSAAICAIPSAALSLGIAGEFGASAPRPKSAQQRNPI